MLPALSVLLLLALWSVAAVTSQLRCVDAATTAARALARGESSAASMAAARAAAPPGARVVVSRSGELVAVEVRAHIQLPGPWSGSLPGLSLAGRAVASVEGGLEPGGGSPVSAGRGRGAAGTAPACRGSATVWVVVAALLTLVGRDRGSVDRRGGRGPAPGSVGGRPCRTRRRSVGRPRHRGPLCRGSTGSGRDPGVVGRVRPTGRRLARGRGRGRLARIARAVAGAAAGPSAGPGRFSHGCR